MRRVVQGALVVLMMFLVGCGAHMRNPEDPNAALVYGYIDMSDAPSPVDYVTVRQYKPKPKDGKPYRGAKGVEGLFWFDQLTPGSYQLVSFGGHSCWKNASYNYSMQDFDKNETALTFDTTGLYFMGSYKYRKVGSFFSNKFEIIRTKTPTEKEVLEWMLPYSTETQWETRIKKRIGALK